MFNDNPNHSIVFAYLARRWRNFRHIDRWTEIEAVVEHVSVEVIDERNDYVITVRYTPPGQHEATFGSLHADGSSTLSDSYVGQTIHILCNPADPYEIEQADLTKLISAMRFGLLIAIIVLCMLFGWLSDTLSTSH